MSDPRAKSERSATKDARQQPAPDAPSTGKKKRKRDKPWVVEERYTGPIPFFREIWKDWGKRKRYATEHQAMKAVESLKVKGGDWEYRVVEKL